MAQDGLLSPCLPLPPTVLIFHVKCRDYRGFPWGSCGEDLAFRCRGCELNPRSGGKDPTCLVAKNLKQKRYYNKCNKDIKNQTDRAAWHVAVHGVAKGRIQPSD